MSVNSSKSELREYISELKSRGSKPGLSRVLTILKLLGSPQDGLKIIHIAGTNGKGSTAAMLESILRESGLKTGMYTSPSLHGLRDYFKINGKAVDSGILYEVFDTIRSLDSGMSDRPTEFEVITAAALKIFESQKCGIVIMEACMGGRLDCTNVCEKPYLTIITDVALDHTAILGDTISKIAFEKAGIMKPNVPVIFGGDDKNALCVIKSRAEELCAPLITVDKNRLKNIRHYSISGTVLDFDGMYSGLEIGLLGTYQVKNAAVVLTAVEELRRLGLTISEDAVRGGLKKAEWHGRFEVLCAEPLIIYDGAHNPQGMEYAAESIRLYFSANKALMTNIPMTNIPKVNILMAIMADKAYDEMVGIISPYAETVTTVTAPVSRSLSCEDLKAAFNRQGSAACAYDNISDGFHAALDIAKRNKLPLLVLGTLYIYPEVISEIERLVKNL